jgi:hypothetical protein
MNVGIHWRTADDVPPLGKRRGASELKRVRAAASGARVRALREHGARVYWIETLAQHFNTTHGLFNSWYDAGTPRGVGKPPSCAPIRDRSAVEELNARARSIVSLAGLDGIVPALADSIDAEPGWHLGLKTAHVAKKGGVDCTHWCEPSPLIARLVDRFLLAAWPRAQLLDLGGLSAGEPLSSDAASPNAAIK